jgi:hypothetical protein
MSDVSASELRVVTDKAAIDALMQGWMFRDIAKPSWDTRRINSNTSGKAEISNIFG